MGTETVWDESFEVKDKMSLDESWDEATRFIVGDGEDLNHRILEDGGIAFALRPDCICIESTYRKLVVTSNEMYQTVWHSSLMAKGRRPNPSW